MSLTTIKAALAVKLRAVTGINYVLEYEPQAVHQAPAIWIVLDSYERMLGTGQLTVMRYRILARVVLNWVDNGTAETGIDTYANLIPAAIDADAQLAGTIPNGLAAISDATTGYIIAGGTKYRVLDVFCDVVEKGPYKGGL